MAELRRGYLFAVAAYGLWGFFPLYWKLLRPAGPVEILAHRVFWSMVFTAAVLTLWRHWSWVRTLLRQPRKVAGISLAAVLISVNWFMYIYGVNSDQVVETALGYFINPLASVLLGVLVLRERLRWAQWAAVGVGALAVVVLTVDYGRPPWIALTLAGSWGCYGLIKKQLGLPAAEGLFVESGVLAVPALGFLVWLTATGGGHFGSVSVGHTALLVGAGAVTAIPLLFFAGAANRIPLTALGILQYLAPCLQLALGVLAFGEPMGGARLAGFGLVWAALVVFTWDGLRQVRRGRQARIAAATGEPVAAR